MDLDKFLAEVERDIREQNETIAKARRTLEGCDPDLCIVTELDRVPEQPRGSSVTPVGAVRV
jgi:hypothetical protein